MDTGDPFWIERARAALISDGRDTAPPLTLTRVKPGQTANYRCGDAVVKLFIGEAATAQALRAHNAQQRAARVVVDGLPIAPRPGPLTDAAFAMDWLEVTTLAKALRHPFAARADLIKGAAKVLRANHAPRADHLLPFGGWPADRLRKVVARAGSLPWPGFQKQVDDTVDALWQNRDAKGLAGFAHGDFHIDNVLVDHGKRMSLIDFDLDTQRPVVIDAANFLTSLAARTPLWRVGMRGALGIAKRDSDAFLAGYRELATQEELLALHMLRFALRRAVVAGRSGWARRGLRYTPQVRRLHRVADRLHTTLFG